MKNSPGSYSPEFDKAKSSALEWTVQPKNRNDIRTFSHINPVAPYIFSAYIEIMTYRKQLNESPLVYECSACESFHLEENIQENCLLTGEIDTDLDLTIEDKQAKSFVEDILLLSPAVNGKRAINIIDMLKNMNRPSNGLGNLMGMLGQDQSDEQDALPMDPPDED